MAALLLFVDDKWTILAGIAYLLLIYVIPLLAVMILVVNLVRRSERERRDQD